MPLGSRVGQQPAVESSGAGYSLAPPSWVVSEQLPEGVGDSTRVWLSVTLPYVVVPITATRKTKTLKLHAIVCRCRQARNAPTWIADEDASTCMLCGVEFGGALSLGNRRHHHGRIRAHVKCAWLAPTTWLRLASNLRLIARLFLLLMG